MNSNHGLWGIDESVAYDDMEHISLEYEEDDSTAAHRREVRKKLDKRLERKRLRMELDDYADMSHLDEDAFDWPDESVLKNHPND